MATCNKNWKSFYQRKKPELQTKYPFLKDYQIREKVKKLWTITKTETTKKARDGNYKPLTITAKPKGISSGTTITDNYSNKKDSSPTERSVLKHSSVKDVFTESTPKTRSLPVSLNEEQVHTNQETDSCADRSSSLLSCSTIDKYKKEKEKYISDRITASVHCVSDSLLVQDRTTKELKENNCHGNNCLDGDYNDSSSNCVLQEKNINLMKRPLDTKESFTGLFQPVTTRESSNTIGNMPTAKRRVFRSSTRETDSNFHTWFSDDDQIFL